MEGWGGGCVSMVWAALPTLARGMAPFGLTAAAYSTLEGPLER